MPITPCFDPTTGASGGAAPAGPGPSLANVPLTEVNLNDGTWTLYDPDNLVKSMSYAAGYHTVTWNAASGGDYNWTATTAHRAPRWHKVLNVSETDILSTDFLVFTSRIQSDLTVAEFNQQVVIGVADDPTTTVATDIDGTGGDGLNMTNSPGTINVNGGTVNNTTGNGFTALSIGDFNLNNTTFTSIGGFTGDVANVDLGGSLNVAGAAFSKNVGVGVTGATLFDLGNQIP